MWLFWFPRRDFELDVKKHQKEVQVEAMSQARPVNSWQRWLARCRGLVPRDQRPIYGLHLSGAACVCSNATKTIIVNTGLPLKKSLPPFLNIGDRQLNNP